MTNSSTLMPQSQQVTYDDERDSILVDAKSVEGSYFYNIRRFSTTPCVVCIVDSTKQYVLNVVITSR